MTYADSDLSALGKSRTPLGEEDEPEHATRTGGMWVRIFVFHKDPPGHDAHQQCERDGCPDPLPRYW